jgi:hypothetical protein
MHSPNADDAAAENDRPTDQERVPGDDLYMMSGGLYVLCSVQRPSTRWIATTVVDDLGERR